MHNNTDPFKRGGLVTRSPNDRSSETVEILPDDEQQLSAKSNIKESLHQTTIKKYMFRNMTANSDPLRINPMAKTIETNERDDDSLYAREETELLKIRDVTITMLAAASKQKNISMDNRKGLMKLEGAMDVIWHCRRLMRRGFNHNNGDNNDTPLSSYK